MEPNDRRAFAVWVTGLPASGKSTLTSELATQLRDLGIHVTVLESDSLRRLFSKTPRYDEQDRDYFYGSLAFIGQVLVEHGVSVIFDATANRRRYRDRARQNIPRFVEVFVECPLEVCMRRDPKGIYRLARGGEATNVPGAQAAYEPPKNPEIIVNGDLDDPKTGALRVVDLLIAKAYLPAKPKQ